MKIEYTNSKLMPFVNRIKHYHPVKYWKTRAEVVNPDSRYPKLLRLYWLYRIKKSDAFNNASMGTGFGCGAVFAEPPVLPHLLNGIVVSHKAKIGKNCTIHQQVTIGEARGGAPVIGDNVFIGAGAKIMGKITIGDHVKIGANAVIVRDVPSNCTVVGVPGVVVKRNSD